MFSPPICTFSPPPPLFSPHTPLFSPHSYVPSSPKICCDLGLGRHTAHKIKISGDALTVSAPNICPSTTTVGTPYVHVICTRAASREPAGKYPVVMAGIRVSGPAEGQSGEAKHRIKIISIHWLYTQDLKFQAMVLSLTGRFKLTMVRKGPSLSLIEKGQSILPMMKFPSSNSRLQTWAV